MFASPRHGRTGRCRTTLDGSRSGPVQRKRALADLRQAVDKGWKDLAALQQNEAFAPLRQDPEYQRLTAALEPRKPNP